MVSLGSLLVPILLAAVLAFLASSLFHMVLPWHRKDFGKLPGEDGVLAAMRASGVGPGEYVLPHAGTQEEMKDPGYQEKLKEGPVAFFTVMSGFGLGKSLVQWFVYCVVVGVFTAYVAGSTLAPGADYLAVFRVTGAVSFAAYVLALWQNSIWYKRPWTTTAKHTIDGLVYSLLTGGTFGWLWPA